MQPFFAPTQVRHNSLPTQDIYCSVQHELHTRIAICNMYAHKLIISWENTNEACLNTFESYRRLSIAGGFHTGRSEREQSRRFLRCLCSVPVHMWCWRNTRKFVHIFFIYSISILSVVIHKRYRRVIVNSLFVEGKNIWRREMEKIAISRACCEMSQMKNMCMSQWIKSAVE